MMPYVFTIQSVSIVQLQYEITNSSLLTGYDHMPYIP